MSQLSEAVLQSECVCPRCGNDVEFKLFAYCERSLRFEQGVQVEDGEFLPVDDEFYYWDYAIRCLRCRCDTRETNYFLWDFIPSLREAEYGDDGAG